jgi:hypothetical protein
MVLHKLPGDISMALLLQSIASQEQRRFSPSRGGAYQTVDLRGVSERTQLTDHGGERLSPEHTVGDVPDPGIVVALLYPPAARDDLGRPVFQPPADQCRTTLLRIASEDSELHAKIDRHLKSPDATLKARLEI